MAETVDAAQAGAGPSNDRTLIIQRVIRASPERVFQAWTDPATLMKWWGPEGMQARDCQLDVRPGGSWRTDVINREGNLIIVSGVYLEVNRWERLVMTWAWRQEDGSRGHETKVIVSFEEVLEGTKIRLVQSTFESVEQRDFHDSGWDSTLNELDRLFN